MNERVAAVLEGRAANTRRSAPTTGKSVGDARIAADCSQPFPRERRTANAAILAQGRASQLGPNSGRSACAPRPSAGGDEYRRDREEFTLLTHVALGTPSESRGPQGAATSILLFERSPG